MCPDSGNVFGVQLALDVGPFFVEGAAVPTRKSQSRDVAVGSNPPLSSTGRRMPRRSDPAARASLDLASSASPSRRQRATATEGGFMPLGHCSVSPSVSSLCSDVAGAEPWSRSTGCFLSSLEKKSLIRPDMAFFLSRNCKKKKKKKKQCGKECFTVSPFFFLGENVFFFKILRCERHFFPMLLFCLFFKAQFFITSPLSPVLSSSFPLYPPLSLSFRCLISCSPFSVVVVSLSVLWSLLLLPLRAMIVLTVSDLNPIAIGLRARIY